MSYLQTPKSRYSPALTQDQLEEATTPTRFGGKREPSAFIVCGLEEKSREQQEVDDLSESWDWFSSVLDQAQDRDYLPIRSSVSPVKASEKTATQSAPVGFVRPNGKSVPSGRIKTLKMAAWPTTAAVLFLACVFGVRYWSQPAAESNFVQQGPPAKVTTVASNQTAGLETQPGLSAQKAQPTSVANLVHTQTSAETNSITDLPDSLFAWEGEDSFDAELSQLSDSFINCNPGDNWSASVACSYQSLDNSFESWQQDNADF